MNSEEIKNKMMGLWKKTFHDSQEYVNLIFDQYFNEDTVAYIEEDGEIVSALLGIPYEFSKNRKLLRGLYLCGLATQPKYRNRGYMHKLIEEINLHALKKGFAFTFLIPENELLINYYTQKKYIKAIYRIEDRYSDIHNFTNDYLTSLNNEDEKIRELKHKTFCDLKCVELDSKDELTRKKIISYINNLEYNSKGYVSILHSPKDINNIIEENFISNGKIIVSYSKEEEITGVGFSIQDINNRTIVQKIYTSDRQSYYRILDYIKVLYPDSPLSIYRYPEETSRKGIESMYFGGPNEEGMMLGGEYGTVERVYNVKSHAKTYGMIRPLDISEILKFLTNDRRDLKFSILIKMEDKENSILKYTADNGHIKVETATEGERHINDNYNTTVLTLKQFSKLIFRKPDNGSALMDAFGIPRLPLNITLMLD